MKIKSGLITQASGSLGGFTASHNRGGLYLRARTIPVNPNSVPQQEVRSLVAQLSNLWLSVLTALQRASWDLYALNVPLPDRLGEPRNVGGLQMYIRSNVPRLQNGLTRVDTGPATFDLGAYSIPILDTLTVAAQTVSVNFAQIDEWADETGSAMLIYTSRPQNLSINYFKGPYRKIGVIPGVDGAPPAPPVASAVAFPFVLAQRVFFRINVTRVDGRLGSEAFAQADSEA